MRVEQVACHAAERALPHRAEILPRGRQSRSGLRHFSFYYEQAGRRLQRPSVARATRALVDRFWAPVGSGVAPDEETRFLARYLFAGPEGIAAARKIDATVRCLPGFADVDLVEAWIAETGKV
jgi:hypothetical protein